jgi:myo-inositol-1(or 4)-monophosphatase
MIENVIHIAKTAGEIIRDGFGKKITIDFKSSSIDLVTEIDKKSEKKIIDFIRKEYLNHNIIAEESGEMNENSEYTWVIDPLDGTTNFAHGLPIFSVSIGVQKKGKTIIGVVYDVMRDVLYSSELGAGSYKDEEKIRVNSNDDLSKSVLVTGFPYNIAENPNKAIEKFSSFLTEARAIRRLGSAAIDFCYLAEGVFEGFWEVQLQPWDICAGKLITEEAGGKVTNFKNENIDIFSKQILATNSHVHEKMLHILQKN